jgi:hypothetical protein
VGIAGSPGWSQTGGTWVAPADAMKKYVWSETTVEGGRRFEGALRPPPTATGPFQGRAVPSAARGAPTEFYRDAVVIAFPTPAAERSPAPPSYQTSAGALDLSPFAAADLAKTVSLPLAEGQRSAWIQATYPAPVRLSAVTLAVPAGAQVELLASDDGATFRSVVRGVLKAGGNVDHPSPQQTLAFAPTSGRVFRLVLSAAPPPPPLPGRPPARGPPPPPPKAFVVAALTFHQGARLHRFEAKAGFEPSIATEDADSPAAPPDAVIPRGQVLDLTSRLRPDGRLEWTPPPGAWTVLRFGWTLTGHANGPAEPEATGLEVDKLDPAAVRRYLAGYLALYEQALGGKLAAAGVRTLLTDSWEAGFQNWTPALLAEFRRRRGYDPLPYAPVLTGRVVVDADTSERFLWDFRLTLKELLADAHQAVIAQTLHAQGLSYYSEAQGDTPRALADGMTLKARSDIPTAEYWYRPFATAPGQPPLKADLEEAASAAHVYGKSLVAAEALTVAAGTDPWAFSPAMLKPVADEIFARGVNRILLHESHLQPLADAKPGLAMFIFGQYFNRNDTWAEEAGAWTDYLARTSFMLQQGHDVADVAYVYGEDRNLTELFLARFNTDVPTGYRYDYINREALLTRLRVDHGRIVATGGATYRILFLADSASHLTLPALRRIRELVAAGAVVAGTRPVGTLGLGGDEAEARRIIDEVWGTQAPPAGRAFGRGRVYATLADALAAEHVAPDFAFAGAGPDAQLLALHRRTDQADIYFVSNQRDRPETVQATFRVTGKAPELWRAETAGAVALSYAQDGGVSTTVPLALGPHEAVFVVFRRPATAPAWQAPRRVEQRLAPLDGPWRVRFEPKRGAPAAAEFERLISWPDSVDPGIRYFSGAATYERRLDIEPRWLAAGQRVVIDLGEVRDLAVVSVNGERVATAWHAPYRVDITQALRPGANRLEVKVVNLWPNRLIGDKQRGATPVAFAPQSPYAADSPLRPSGLLGPVTLLGVTQEDAAR